MATEPELLQAVLSAPDEDGPRSDYAAFCEAEGNPRGEFIRLQLEIERAHKAGEGERVERILKGRAGQLLDAGSADWSANFSPLVDGLTFHRGFVAWVRLSAQNFLDRAPDLFALAPIQHVDLTDVSAVLDDVVASAHLQKIRSLALDRCGLDNAAMAKIAASPHLPQLRWLSLGENQIGLPGAAALAASQHFPALAYVRFFGNLVDPRERYSYDSGMVVDSWLPDEGTLLEAQFGHIPWLHGSPATADDVVPDRFRI